MTRKPTATLQPGKHGTWTVVRPNGNTAHADTLDEAQRIAIRAGAVLIRIEGPVTGPARKTLWRTL